MRGVLKNYSDKLFKEKNYTLNAATEIEGFLFAGKDAEQRYHETGKFEFVNTGGYYHVLPLDPLRQFIDTAAEVQRAMGFQNEKDHPEVAPSQFEINFGYARGGGRRRPDSALQAALPPDRQQHGIHGLLPAQANGRRERQRHAHQRLCLQGQEPTCSGTRRARSSSPNSDGISLTAS